MDIQYKTNNFLKEQKKRLLDPNIKINEDNNIKYELIDDLKKTDYLEDMGIFLPNFMELLWKQPNIVSKILLNANSKEISEHLSYFFCHNFYENILSPNYIEYNLLYLITLMLKEEINNFSKKSQGDFIKLLESFLNNTPTGMLLEQFQKKNDVQTFFNTILLNLIKDLERSSSNREITFDLDKIEVKCKQRKPSVDNKSVSKSIDTHYSFISTDYLSDAGFFTYYILDLDIEYFNDKIASCKDDKKKNIMGYFLYHSNFIDSEKKKKVFSSEIFNIKNTEELNRIGVLDEYITNFDKTINLMTDLFKNLIDYIYFHILLNVFVK